MQFFDNNCLSHHCCVSRTPVFREHKTKNNASQDCSASHHCRLVSNLFEIRHAKHLWFTHAKQKRSFTHHTSPLLNWRRPETCKAKIKLKQFHLPRKFLQENHATCRSKTKTKNVCLVSVVSMRHANENINMLRGPFVRHELRPKWPLPVLCCTHRLLSS